MIIDAHMHLPVCGTDLETRKIQLLSDMERDNVDFGIVISDSELESDIGSMDDCLTLFGECSNVFVSAGISPRIDFNAQLAKLRRYLAEGRVIAVKIYCGHEPIYIDDGILKPLFDTACEFRVPVMFHSGWDNAEFAEPERIKKAALSNPSVSLVCCHCFYPEVELCLRTLKNLPNVYFDISSIADDTTRISAVKETLERYVPLIPERFVFGSDYAGCDRNRHIELCNGLDIPEQYKKMLFGLNARRLYGI